MIDACLKGQQLRIGFVLFLAAVASLSTHPVSGSIVANGSFEDQDLSAPALGLTPPNQWKDLTSSTPISPINYLPGWQVLSVSSNTPQQGQAGINLLRNGGGFSKGDTPAGKQYIDLDGSPGRGGVSQVLTLVPNQQYTLSFIFANNYDGWNGPGFPLPATVTGISALVELIGSGPNLINAADRVLTHFTSDGSSLNWTNYSTTFNTEPGVTSYTLRFTSTTVSPQNVDNYGILLDDVSVNGSSAITDVAPEASSVAIWLLLGLTVGVGQAKLRRRDAA